MKNRRYVLLVLLLIVVISLLPPVTVLADDTGEMNADHGPGGSKLPGSQTPTPVPEPATMALMAGGLAGLYGLRKKFAGD